MTSPSTTLAGPVRETIAVSSGPGAASSVIVVGRELTGVAAF